MLFAPFAVVLSLMAPVHHHHHHHHKKHHKKHHQHHKTPPPPMHTAIASWYYDSGSTASGRHYRYGFAALIFGSAWGTKVQFCYKQCVIGQLDDHGPYVGGRTFDLNPALKNATGCPDLCTVRWRVVT